MARLHRPSLLSQRCQRHSLLLADPLRIIVIRHKHTLFLVQHEGGPSAPYFNSLQIALRHQLRLQSSCQRLSTRPWPDTVGAVHAPDGPQQTSDPISGTHLKEGVLYDRSLSLLCAISVDRASG